MKYRGYEIYENDFRGHPDWRKVQWMYCHEDYDGFEDSRCGACETIEECKIEIDWLEDDVLPARNSATRGM
jgi:hypothetical protein